MHATQIEDWGSSPKYVEIDAPPLPTNPETVQVRLTAAAIHQVVRTRATGKHYMQTTLPHCPGVDGTGTLADGTPVYFETMSSGQGSFAEIINVPQRAVRVLPEGADPVTMAAMVNPGTSSWMAMYSRVDKAKLPQAFTVVILGATSTSGVLAVSVVRHFGAGRVVGIARKEEKMKNLSFDDTIVLKDDVMTSDFSKLGDVDVVLDYLYGAPMLHLISSLKSSRPTQYVQIGTMAGPEASLPAALLRSKDITIRGAGPGSWQMADMANQTRELLKVLALSKPCDIAVRKLAEIERVWDSGEAGARIVFVP